MIEWKRIDCADMADRDELAAILDRNGYAVLIRWEKPPGKSKTVYYVMYGKEADGRVPPLQG